MEKRRFNRVIVNSAATLCQGKQQWPVTLVDVSLQGALLSVSSPFDGDTSQSFLLDIPLPQLDTAIVLEGDIKHVREGLMGFHIELMDIDSATQLRRVVELNLADESLLQRDLDALINHYAESA
ncbi:PilZ domain-containing protein [Aestuariibacter salexigens]|uniref:PilZ domain-containing protein n=1 Tax=Aestuariibacter salexigens TaxID=226010 RepID=UPI0003FFB8FF|nr:PilZ domain-containing protein [Aestuariibacter salexigens]